MTFRTSFRSVVAGAGFCAALAAGAAAPLSAQTMPQADAGVGIAAVSTALADAFAAVDRAWAAAPLGFAVATFATDTAKGVGLYTPRGDASFASGETMHVYAELLGYGYGRAGDSYEIGFSTDFELLNANGQVLAGQEGFADLTMSSRTANREYQASLTFRFDGLKPGDYVLRTRFNDRHSDKAGSFSLPFSIKAEGAAQ